MSKALSQDYGDDLMKQIDKLNPETTQPTTKRQQYNQRPGRQAIVKIPVDGLSAPLEVAIVRFDQRTGTVELEIPVSATISHRAG